VKIARGFGNWEKCVQIMERYFVIGDLLSIAPIHALDVSEVGHQGVWLILVTKFIWNFTIYCGKNKDTKKVVRVAQGGGMFGS
jgi:hypothetical protein